MEGKGAFPLHRTSGPLRTGHNLRLIWRRTLDPRPLFTPNRCVERSIPDYFGANQWCRMCVSGSDNHSLLITSKESQLAIQFFHYRLPLCPVQLRAVGRVNVVAKSNKFPFPMILVWDENEWPLLGTPWKIIWLVDESDVGLILFLGDKRSDVRESVRGWSDEAFLLHFWGQTSISSVRSEADQTSDGVKKHPN